jgi:hypothetical protein
MRGSCLTKRGSVSQAADAAIGRMGIAAFERLAKVSGLGLARRAAIWSGKPTMVPSSLAAMIAAVTPPDSPRFTRRAGCERAGCRHFWHEIFPIALDPQASGEQARTSYLAALQLRNVDLELPRRNILIQLKEVIGIIVRLDRYYAIPSLVISLSHAILLVGAHEIYVNTWSHGGS